MVWIICLGSLALMIAGDLLLQPSGDDVWNRLANLLLLVFGGACVYGFASGLRHVTKRFGFINK